MSNDGVSAMRALHGLLCRLQDIYANQAASALRAQAAMAAARVSASAPVSP